MPSAPQPSSGAAPAEHMAKQPLGSVTVLVYDWSPGQTEVQIQWPKVALPGAQTATTHQARFRDLVNAELKDAFRALSDSRPVS